MYDVFIGLTLFLLYSFIGWIMEVIVTLWNEKRLVNRGFLIGPLCPIYGVGALLILALLGNYKEDALVLFLMAMVVCTILEYVTSYAMEKLFGSRWWDYSDRLFNIDGRVCLRNTLAFGVLALLIEYIVNPFIVDIIHLISPILLKSVISILMIIFIIDFCVSCKIISSFREVGKKVGRKVFKDSTEEISAKVKATLRKKNIFTRRVVNAFPNFIYLIKKKGKKK